MQTARWIIAPQTKWGRVLDDKSFGIHASDLLVLGMEGKAIPILGIRQAQRFVSETPVGPSRVVILAGIDILSLPAANALLKLLEEPPANARIIIISETGRILPTIRSRVIAEGGLAADEISAKIAELATVDSKRAHEATYLGPLLHSTVSKSVILEGIFQS